MTERAKERSAFCTRCGLFQFTHMPFGLSDTPGSFCHLMFNVLRDLLWEICLCYLDDIIMFGRTPQELLEPMRTVLDRLRLVGQAFEMHAFQNPDWIRGSSCQCSWNSSHARQSQRSLRLFDVTHAGPLAAHFDSEKTLLQLKQLYYWPGMTTTVPLWYSQCEVCAQSGGPPTKHQSRLQKVLTGVPLDIVAIDILWGLPTTADGMKYILVVIDYFTNWVSAFPLPDAEASTACESYTTVSSQSSDCLVNYIWIKVKTSNANFSKNFAI